MSNLTNLVGRQYGDLTVIRRNLFNTELYVCRCTCGNEKEVRSSNIQRLKTTHCGCKTKRGRKSGIGAYA